MSDFMPEKITLTQPDDWHLHLRDGAMMASILPDTARQFGRAIVMPNLKPPVTTIAQAEAYRQRILDCLPKNTNFQPLMTLYLTDQTDPAEIRKAAESDVVHAAKLYPAGATTNSDSGVTNINNIDGVLEVLVETGMPLLVHGEVVDPEVDLFDREAVFIERVLAPTLKKFPNLKVVFEHLTTNDGVDFVLSQPENVGATLTAHHLLLSRNAMFAGGMRPHHYCLPVLKRETHRQKLIEAATSGNPKFFLGTDSAPHPKHAKESSHGCGGIYTSHAAIALYAEVFEVAGALDKLEAFASFHGADFYGLPRNSGKITLVKEVWEVPQEISYGNSTLVPLRAGEKIQWKLAMEG